MKKCPHCAEEIQDDAVVCRYCGRRLLRRRPNLIPRRKRTVLLVGAAACAVLTVTAVLVLPDKTGPSSYLYLGADQAYYLDWHAHGIGTLWATYVNPQDGFQVESGTTGITVTTQGSAVSIQAPGQATPTLGQRNGKDLGLALGTGGGFGPWTGQFSFSPGSLKDYETAVATVQQTGAQIAANAADYASRDIADANSAATLSTEGNCILYLSGTDVSVTVHGGDASAGASGACEDLVAPYGDLGSGGTWSASQTGANYPGQASLACEYANDHASEFVVVGDAGFQQYGGTLCRDLGNAGGWFALRSSG